MKKSTLIFPLVMILVLTYSHTVYRILEEYSIPWLALLISQTPIILYLGLQFTRKFKDRDSQFKVLTMLAIFGPSYSMLNLVNSYSVPALFVLINSLVFLVPYLLIVFWVPRLKRKNNSHLIYEGSQFPSFVLDDQNSNPLSSDELLGQPGLFIFFRGNWCPLCMAQLKDVSQAYTEITNMGIRIILVSSQSHENTQKLASNFNVDFTYLVDDKFILTDKLAIRDINGTPAVFGFGHQADTIFPTVVLTNDKGRVVYLNQTDNFRNRPEPEQFIKVIKQFNLQNFLEEKIEERTLELNTEKKKSENLLLNILPKHTANELKETGHSSPRQYTSASILFTDFKDFTKISADMSPQELIKELEQYFTGFDEIIHEFGLERIKTIGDSYMAAGGLPVKNTTNAIDTVLAAIKMRDFTNKLNSKRKMDGKPVFELRIGINTGEVVAGVVGTRRFAFDIWGDAVNLASRIESHSEPGKINISINTYEKIKYFFNCIPRGKIEVKNKGQVEMYFVDKLKKNYALQDENSLPNARFNQLYQKISKGVRIAFNHEIAKAS